MKTLDEILKIKAVVAYILQRMPEGIDYIHLFKMVYFAQQEHLKTYGMPLMAETFVARNHCLVALLTSKVLGMMEDGASCDMDELSVSNTKVLDKWIERCKDVQSFDLSDLSHDKAWQRAKEQTEKTGEDTKITFYDMAEAAGASKEMLHVIRERQINQKLTAWI
jgi:hypothetical protein